MDCTEILETVAKAANIKKIGVLSEADFMSILPSGGKIRQKYRDGSVLAEISAQIQCKGTDQKGLIQSLEATAGMAIRTRYPTTDRYRIMSVSQGSLPMPIMANEKGEFIYGCSIIVKYFAPRKTEVIK